MSAIVQTIKRRLFDPRHMIDPSRVQGPLPSGREMYGEALRVAWPATAEGMLVSLTSIVDTIMVGAVGTHAIAAVGLTNQPKMLIYLFFFALNAGITAVVARRRGEENRQDANAVLRQALTLALGIGIVMTIVGITVAEPLLRFIGAQQDTIGLSVPYFRILMIGTIPQGITFTINAAQRGAGNTKVSMRTNLTSNIVNVCFNFLLIGGRLGFPRLETRGAAIATVIGICVACGMAVFSVMGHEGFLSLRVHGGRWLPRKVTMSPVARVSLSAGVEQIFFRIGFFSYAKIVAGLGTDAFATQQIAMNMSGLSFTAAEGTGVAAAALVGKSLGQKRADLATLYIKITGRIAQALALINFVIFFFGASGIVSLYTNEAAIVPTAVTLIRFIAFISFPQMAQVAMAGALRGAGDTKMLAVTSLVSVAAIRPVLAWTLCYPVGLGIFGAWISYMFDYLLRLTFVYIRYRSGKWSKIKL